MTEECLSHGYLTGEQKRNKKCTVLSSITHSTCYLFWKCYAHTLFYALCSLLSFLPTSWLSLLTLLTKPGSFTSAQPSVFKFWVTLHPELSTWDTYVFNIKLKKVIFLSNSDCHLINIDFFFLCISGDFTTSWIPEEIKHSVQLHVPFIPKITGTQQEPFQEHLFLSLECFCRLSQEKNGCFLLFREETSPRLSWVSFSFFFLYYYMCKLAVLIFVCCQQCFALLMEAIYPKRKFDAKNWKGAKW